VGKPNAHGLADCVALLTHSHRFSAESGISALSQQVNAGYADAALDTLQQGNYPDLGYSEQVDAELLYQNRTNYWQTVRDLTDLNLVQQAFVAFMPLVSERRQVEQINRIVEQRLERDGLKPVGQLWYPGRPVMITTNDYGLDLFNGDIGFTRMCSDGLRVAFPLADGGWRELAPGRLPAHDTVYAMTVHKSQGSEFSETWLVLPEGGSALLDRALVYTAITRARTQFRICGSLATLYAAIGHAPARFSGLARRLQA
jgi:exodeoxyribonuclease V alpha subunit